MGILKRNCAARFQNRRIELAGSILPRVRLAALKVHSILSRATEDSEVVLRPENISEQLRCGLPRLFLFCLALLKLFVAVGEVVDVLRDGVDERLQILNVLARCAEVLWMRREVAHGLQTDAPVIQAIVDDVFLLEVLDVFSEIMLRFGFANYRASFSGLV